MSVFKAGGESDCAALRHFLVNLAVNGYQSFQAENQKSCEEEVCDNHLSVFISVVYHRVGMCQSDGLNCLGVSCGHFHTTSAERYVFPI